MINIDTRLLDELTADELWLICHIVKRFDERLICWPSNKTLCSDTKWSMKKMQGVKANLIEKGVLISKERFKEKSQSSNTYMINTDLLGVYVPAKKITVGLQGDKSKLPTPPDESDILYPPKSKRDNEVLTSEVLTKDVESKDSTSKKPLTEAEQLSIEPIKKAPPAKNEVYTKCVELWLKTYRPGWTFGGAQGKALKSILIKIKGVFKNAGWEGNEDQIVNTFKELIEKLPEWYKTKDLMVIDSKFNEIITEIQNGKQQQTYNSKNSADRFSDFAGR
jgi:hypothetical protein